MSDLMLLGVLQMPFDIVMSSPTSIFQYVQRGHEAAKRIKADGDLIEQQAAALEAANARIAELEAAAKAEPVGEVVANDPVHGWHFQPYIGWQQLGAGRKLYTAPAATDNGGGRDAWISVDERLPENDQTVAFVVKADDDSCNGHLNGRVLGGTYHKNWGFSTPGLGHRASHWMPLPAAPAALSQKGEQG